MRRAPLEIGLLLAITVLFVGCYSTGPEVLIGPEIRHDLVIFFKRDATHDQIENFRGDVLSYSWWGCRYEVAADYLRLFPVDGYEAIALKFHSDVSQANRKAVKSKVRASPIVHKVFEDVVPQDIKHVD